ncbi:MAG: glycosyltransferase family 4 protein [Bacteroidales bacterium]|jgi:glycosyltransferase involved in cell wall biosynthesis|nr:glycosyltransferase family 4 protein [Bacteroidales bacterium]MDD4214093.1 glycosyltransferase family 4 protein [Bacteroidales bacterium]
MKILVLNYEYPPLGGGAGVITQQISEGLAYLGHNITVVTTWFEKLPENEEKDNLKIIRLKSARKYTYRSNVFEMLSWIKHSKKFLAAYCCENKLDVCLTNFSLPGGEVGFFLKKRFGIPYTVISHGHDIPWYFAKEMFFYHLLTYFRIKKICKASAFNFLLNADMKKNADKFLGEKDTSKNIIIPNGCDMDFFKPGQHKKSGTFKILFTGRLVQQKDPFTFLGALKQLAEKQVRFTAIIVGDGILRNDMEKYVKNNFLTNNVTFKGWMTREQILEEYQSASVFVQTSIYEAMSVAPLEAMACGTYVICTPAGANRDIIFENENGDTFSTGNSSELSEKLFNFYNTKYKNGLVVSSELIDKIRTLYCWRNRIILKYQEYLGKSCR